MAYTRRLNSFPTLPYCLVVISRLKRFVWRFKQITRSVGLSQYAEARLARACTTNCVKTTSLLVTGKRSAQGEASSAKERRAVARMNAPRALAGPSIAHSDWRGTKPTAVLGVSGKHKRSAPLFRPSRGKTSSPLAGFIEGQRERRNFELSTGQLARVFSLNTLKKL